MSSTTTGTSSDAWASVAAEYRKFTERPGEQLAGEMLPLVDGAWPLSQAVGILDNGCGPGVITENLMKAYGTTLPASAKLFASDASPAMLEQLRRSRDEHVANGASALWKGLQVTECDAAELRHIPDDSLSHVLGGFVYFMLKEPRKALTEARRVLKDGGALAVSSWQGSEWMDLMLLIEKFPIGGSLFQIPPGWKSPEGVKGELEATGYKNVVSKPVKVTLKYDDQETLVSMLAEKTPMMGRLTSQMGSEDAERLRQMMRDKLTEMHGPGGGTMVGTAILAMGQKSSSALD